jgi:hypothetical protein
LGVGCGRLGNTTLSPSAERGFASLVILLRKLPKEWSDT